MGKSANKQLLNNSGTAQSTSKNLSTEAGQDYNYLDPKLKAEADNPEGYTPQQQAYINTATQQSAGGATSAITGQANLEAARTRNAGGFQGAIGTGSRDAMKTNSQNALTVAKAQADLQQQQRQQAMQSLQQLYAANTGAGLDYLNASTNALGEENKSHPLQQGVDTASNLIKALSGKPG